MKQEVIGHLFALKDKMYEITDYLYNYTEESFKEHKTVDYITDLLESNNFKINKSFTNIPTAFHAEYGEGHPKICFICEYDGDKKDGQIHGNNLCTAISIVSAMSLSKVLTKVKGSVIVIGTPGELLGGTKITMDKQKAFSDLDAIMIARPHIYNIINPNCHATLPLKVVFSQDTNKNSKFNYTPKEAYFFMINFLPLIINSSKVDCSIENLLLEESQLKFDIKATSMEKASDIRGEIELVSETIEKITGLHQETSLSSLPCDEMTANETLNRIFSHNLKECGIINFHDADCSSTSSTLGCISKTIPCISPYISIVEDENTIYPSPEFAEKTLWNYAQDIGFKAAQALALTGLDLLEKDILINESKSDLY